MRHTVDFHVFVTPRSRYSCGNICPLICRAVRSCAVFPFRCSCFFFFFFFALLPSKKPALSRYQDRSTNAGNTYQALRLFCALFYARQRSLGAIANCCTVRRAEPRLFAAASFSSFLVFVFWPFLQSKMSVADLFVFGCGSVRLLICSCSVVGLFGCRSVRLSPFSLRCLLFFRSSFVSADI